MTVTDVQPKPQGKIAKRLTEQRIIATLPPGYTLIKINWKKRSIHFRRPSGKVVVKGFFGAVA